MSTEAPAEPRTRVHYPAPIEAAIARLISLLHGEYGLSARAVALLLLQGDAEVERLVRAQEGERAAAIAGVVAEIEPAFSGPLSYVIGLARQAAADRIAGRTASPPTRTRGGFAEWLGRAMMRPLTGLPILLIVVYFGLYKFVGVFGAGTLVNLLERTLFGRYINPWLTAAVTRVLPWPVANSLFVGEYGLFTLGLKYAVAIILPIVTTFFLVFAIIEDTGYLPRLALLTDRLLKRVGLSGRAVIPMVLGFGCDTMATMVTRVLETTRERVIATLLLALAIPCSAQLGVILALLAGWPAGLAIWAGVVGLVFLLVGYLAAKLMPGRPASFYIEVPPLRWPAPANVLVKTYTRLEWYLAEVLPLFLFASVLIWVGQLTHVFQWAVTVFTYPVQWIGLPRPAAVAFLFGFFRRDYGAAGLYDLARSGGLTPPQLLVAMVTLTLFLPCVAQLLMMSKERGWRTALAMAAFIVPFAFGVGFGLHAVLRLLRI